MFYLLVAQPLTWVVATELLHNYNCVPENEDVKVYVMMWRKGDLVMCLGKSIWSKPLRMIL